MLSLKYIRIRKERPAEQCLSSIWREACSVFGIPCLLIYLDGNQAYISASLKHLANLPGITQSATEIQEKLLGIQLLYANTAKGYWKHNDFYHTFDSLPAFTAKEAAAAIFEVFSAYLHHADLTIGITEASNSNPLEEAPA